MKIAKNAEFLNLLKVMGENIKMFREKQKISLYELSVKTEINERYLKKIEAGKAVGIKTTQVIALLCALKISSKELFEKNDIK